MSPFRLIIEQIAPGRSSYQFYLICDNHQRFKGAEKTPYGMGFTCYEHGSQQARHYNSVEKANQAAQIFEAKLLDIKAQVDLKAKDAPVNSRIHWYNNPNHTGRIIANNMLDGDEVVAVEWDDGSVAKENINDLVLIKN